MRRRRYLAGLAGVASPLAGCSGGGNADAGGDDGTGRTVTPAPVPDGATASVADGRVMPAAVGDAHVEALSRGSATVAVEYTAGREAQPFDLARLLATVDGGAFTHRLFDIREPENGAVARRFRGFWYENGEAVVRVVEEGEEPRYFESEAFTPPPAAERFDRARLVDLLAAFGPSATDNGDGYGLAADEVAAPDRLPTPRETDGSERGELRGRLAADGAVAELSAVFGVPPSRAGSDPTVITYRLAVTDRGSTAVERPDAAGMMGWYRELRDGSPVPEDATRVERPDW